MDKTVSKKRKREEDVDIPSEIWYAILWFAPDAQTFSAMARTCRLFGDHAHTMQETMKPRFTQARWMKPQSTWMDFLGMRCPSKTYGRFLPNGWKHGAFRVYAYYTGMSKNVLEEGKYQDNKREGVWTCWNQSGERIQERNYRHGKPEGTWIYLYGKGEERMQENYKDGKLEGIWIHRYRNGKERKKGRYLNGKREGMWTRWYINGCVGERGEYQGDEREGTWISWYGTGEKLKEKTYQNGKPVGTSISWYRNGKKEKEKKYQNGVREGV